jgi:hypothetical protein
MSHSALSSTSLRWSQRRTFSIQPSTLLGPLDTLATAFGSLAVGAATLVSTAAISAGIKLEGSHKQKGRLKR